MQTADTVLAQLRDGGFRITPRRRRLAQILAEHREPLAAPAIVALVNRTVSANKTTVYRDLAAWTRAGILHAVAVRSGVTSYELAGRSHHHHIVCVSCGQMRDTDSPALERALAAAGKALERATGYRTVSHSLEFFGRCPRCAGRKN